MHKIFVNNINNSLQAKFLAAPFLKKKKNPWRHLHVSSAWLILTVWFSCCFYLYKISNLQIYIHQNIPLSGYVLGVCGHHNLIFRPIDLNMVSCNKTVTICLNRHIQIHSCGSEEYAILCENSLFSLLNSFFVCSWSLEVLFIASVRELNCHCVTSKITTYFKRGQHEEENAVITEKMNVDHTKWYIVSCSSGTSAHRSSWTGGKFTECTFVLEFQMAFWF
jgi:hypothetical protein